MKHGLLIGSSWRYRHLVRPEFTVPEVFGQGSQMHRGTRGLASVFLLALMEESCWRTVGPFIEPGQVPVGHEFNFVHSAPSAVGDVVAIDVTCTEVSDRTDLSWLATAHNVHSGEVVGTLRHHMKVVDRARFSRKLRRPG